MTQKVPQRSVNAIFRSPSRWRFWVLLSGLVGAWLVSLTSACEPTKVTKVPSESTSTEVFVDASVEDGKPHDMGVSDVGPREVRAEPRQEVLVERVVSSEQTRDAAVSEPTREPAKPDVTPFETSLAPDAGLTKGVCQKTSPRCPPGYGCRDDVTPPTCHLACDPEKPSCPGGSLCLVLSTGAGVCVRGQVAQKGEKCDLQNICDKGLVCVLSAPPKGTCYQRCTLQNQQCPAGEVCFLAHSKNGACIKGQAGTKVAGDACASTLECQPGLICFLPFRQTKKVCAPLCDTDHPCPAGKTCAQIDGAPKNAGACK